MNRFTVRADTGLKQFLAQALGISKGKAKELIDARLVFVNERRTWIATHRLRAGDRVDVTAPAAVAARPRLAVLFENQDIIAVNKPPGFVSDRDPKSIEALLRSARNDPAIRAIHRLDRDTSGVFLLATGAAAFEHYKAVWTRHDVLKTYLALCHGTPRFEQTEVAMTIDRRKSYSKVFVVAHAGSYCLLRIETATGRKHQVRRHLSSLRHPIVGDKDYGLKLVADVRMRGVNRQMLHCERLALPVVDAGRREERREIRAPLFHDFRSLARRLGLLR